MRKMSVAGSPDTSINGISMYSPSSGFVVFNQGPLFTSFNQALGFTTDSGRTFIKKQITDANINFNGFFQHPLAKFNAAGVVAFHADTLFLYGTYFFAPSIVYSVNGGNTFKMILGTDGFGQPYGDSFEDMVFLPNSNIGYAVEANRIFKTTNRGQTWLPVYTNTSLSFEKILAIDNNNLFAYDIAVNSTKVFKSSNAGQTWSQLATPPGDLRGASFYTASKGYASSALDYERLFFTSNGGATWTPRPVGSPIPSMVDFINDSTGYGVDENYTTYKTTDSGRVWERLPRDNSFQYNNYGFHEFQRINSNQFFLAGRHALLEMTTNGGGIPVPFAGFSIDTTGYWLSSTINVTNFSKPGYQFKWFRNGNLVSTGYHYSYVHPPDGISDTIKLIVTNSANSDSLTRIQAFHPPIAISSFTPTSIFGGGQVMITGQNFTGTTAVYFGGVAASSFTVLNSTNIRAIVGSGASGNITVYGPNGYATLPGFTFLPPPVITSISPAIAASGSTVTITGTNFTGATSVSFGNIPAVSFIVVNATTITAVVGVGATGNVKVTTPYGTSTSASFSILPTLSSFTPTIGTIGTYVTLTGTGFGGVTSVKIGGVSVTSFVINSNTGITAIVSSGASGDVSVISPAGISTLPGFSWYPAPVITGISPLAAPAGATVVITGQNFNASAAANSVSFGGVRATVAAATATSLTVVVPAGASCGQISVMCNTLRTSSSQLFQLTFPDGGAITTSSFLPTQIPTPVGSFRQVKSADIDGDGKADIAITISTPDPQSSGTYFFRNTSSTTSVSFDNPVFISTDAASALELADIDGDGKFDLIQQTAPPSALGVFRNLSTPGSISFAPPVIVASSVPTFMPLVAEDLDRDGKLDLISEAFPNILFLLRNISDPGKIAFAPRINITVACKSIITADLDNDLRPEIIVSSNGDDFKVLKNNSVQTSLSFGTPVSIPGFSIQSVAAGDIDGDGKNDIVAISELGSSVTVYKNISSGNTISFEKAAETPTTTAPEAVIVGDLDGDGKPDVALTTLQNNLELFKNTSNGSSISLAPKVSLSPLQTTGWKYMLLADINGDGKVDPVVAPEVSATLTVYVNNVKPAPQILSFTPALAVAGTTVTITGTNFNGATAVSFGGTPATSFTVNSSTSITAIVATGSSGEVSVTNPAGTGVRPGFVFGLTPVITNFTPRSGAVGTSVTITGSNFSPNASLNQVMIGNVRATILTASTNQLVVTVPHGAVWSPITVTTNSLTASSASPFHTTFPGATPGFSSSSFAPRADYSPGGTVGYVADMDGDGKLDVVAMNGGNVTALRNTTTGSSVTFGSPVSVALPAIMWLSGGDVDGDGKIDIITSNNDNSMSVLRNTSMIGTISFAPRIDIIAGAPNTITSAISMADIDGDGRPEMALTVAGARSVKIYHNLSSPGSVNLVPKFYVVCDNVPGKTSFADVDGDGKVELLVTVGNKISVFRNVSTPGNPAFAAPVDASTASSSNFVTTGDIDGDGKIDLVASNFSAVVSVVRNTSQPGSISFDTRVDLPLSDGGYHVGIADLDGDGKLDVYSEYKSNQKVAVLKNLSTPGTIDFASNVTYPTPNLDMTYSGSAGDFDNDGKTDLIVFHLGPHFSIYRNIASGGASIAVCQNGTAAITSSITGTGYQWQQNSGSGFANISDNANFAGTSSASLQLSDVPLGWNNNQYRCVVNGTNITSPVMLSVNPGPGANAGADRTICSGTSTTLGIPGSPVNTYLWTSNSAGFFMSTASSPQVGPTSTTSYFLAVSDGICTSKDTVVVTVSPAVTAAISITANTTSVCSGGTVSFTATAVNGGSNPSYQWQLNSANVGTNSSSFTTAPLTGNSNVRVLLTSNAQCVTQASVTSNIVALAVSGGATPGVSISPSASTICAGGSVTFTATSANGGSSPVYQWKVNGVDAGTNSPTFTTVNLTNGSQVQVVMTTNLACAGSNTATSNNVIVTVHPIPTTPVITRTGSLISSSSVSGNQWYRNGTLITGATGQTINSFLPGIYTVVVTLNGCASAVSNAIDNSVATAINSPVLNSQLTIAPNPVYDELIISYAGSSGSFRADVIDGYGRVVRSVKFGTKLQLSLGSLSSGNYFIRVVNLRNGEQVQKLILKL